MAGNLALRSWRHRLLVSALALAATGCTGPAPVLPSAASPPSAGTARIWFYRAYEPSVSLNMANVALNGARVASVEADGRALYRDVPSGRYHIAAESGGTDFNQSKDVELAAGQEAFVKILTQGSWESGGDLSSYHRDTFYVSLVPEQLARAELAAPR